MAPQSLDVDNADGSAAGARPHPQPRRASLSTYLVIPVVLFAVAAAGSVFYQRRAAADDARRSALLDARWAARSAAQEITAAVEQKQAQLATTAADPALAEVFADPAGCALAFSPFGPFHSGHIDIVTVDGNVICSSLPAAAAPEYADASWLGAAGTSPVVEGPVRDSRTGEQSLLISAPIGTRGMLVAFAHLEPVGADLSKAFGGPRRLEFLVLSTQDKTVVAPTQTARRWVGESVAGMKLASIRDRGEAPGLDGTARYFGRAEIAPTGWSVLAGAEKARALAAATRLSNRQTAIVLVGFVLFVAAGWVVYRRIARPIEVLSAGVRRATANAAAEPVEVSGPVEVTQLVDDFNRLLAAARREREVAAQFLAIVESSPEAIVGINIEGTVTSWNGSAEQMFGYPASEAIGQPGPSFVQPGQEIELAETMARAVLGERIHAYETRILHKNGHVVPVEASAAPVYDADGRVVAVSVSIRDLTQRMRAEAERRELEARVRRAERINEQERELRLLEDRERIGRDLHDTVIQRLYATGVSLDAVAGRIADTDVKQRLGRAVDEIDATIREIRSAIFAMESGAFLRTREAFEDVAAAASEALGVLPTLTFVGSEANIPPHVVDQMLAVLRESLSNVTRHAGATRVRIAITVGDEIVLQVADNGVGVDALAVSENGGLGVASMRARAERLGGSFTIEPDPAGGTRVEWRVPREGRSNR